MEMKTVHYYIAVAEELNLTRAAERLMMSQPPLSYQMKKLEEELGVTLFLRGKRRLELTDAGKLFLRRAYELEALEEKSREEMQSFDEIPDVIVLDAKVIDGESLGQCECRLAKSE